MNVFVKRLVSKQGFGNKLQRMRTFFRENTAVSLMIRKSEDFA